ncbi:AAA domain-containing protein, putative AbiEii toxin, Type IV TA system [Chryseobacterium ureilyticum]|uniref:AAA domain-containing protein, putative AbiEii toxin, Type IV TA system n=1 Tax=Chryseobacterium ureilyticum TaxID=373668 RepID=A0A1N7PRY7_9FLAO|nr:AAA family ATPase [Chryseobacterium ureilyticum]SIT13320.1 AAA domain-containing protein, putative AbiEii toxin, Type IV TA system [Chryseobacterium ureilyticum]
MEFKLPYEIKERIFNDIISLDNPFGLNTNYTLVDFLSKFLNLKDLPSEDSRYINAYDDAVQHLINNDDWNYWDTFVERFKILDTDDLFKSFLEALLDNIPNDDRIVISALIDNYLDKFNYQISKNYDLEGDVVYTIRESDLSFNISDIPENNILFLVTEKKEALIIKEYPCFVLQYDSWDDYGFKTRFELRYYDSERTQFYIGKVRILKKNIDITYDSLDKEFYKLNNDYCSLSSRESYYFELKEALGDKYLSVLAALNDVAYFPSICEKFENEKGFITSLCRNEKESEKILRTIRAKLTYGDISDLFNFTYIFTPVYSEFAVSFKFNFEGNKSIPKRIYSIIGKNGVGKTLLIKDLLKKLSLKDSGKILPKIPLYGKIIVASFSYFDAYEKTKNKLDFNFLFCGLINVEEKRPLRHEEIKSKLVSSMYKLTEKNVLNKYFFIIKEFIDEELLNEITQIPRGVTDIELLRDNEDISIKINTKKISSIIDKMSSGQLALFYIITEIVANIRYNSLLIFDEPETHLHPNAITEFMSAIIHLLEEFDSYCIIATHSPLVVREVFSDSIYVFEKDENIPRVRKLEFETFGENLSTITEEIFGNRDVSKYYVKTIESLVNGGKSYEEIESLIEGDVPLNLNLKILIKSLVKNRDEES